MSKKVIKFSFSDDTPVKKWHRVLLSQVEFFGLSARQAREAILLNPYLAKHKDDFDRVFEDCKPSFTAEGRERPMAIENYKKWFGLEAK